MTREEAIGIGIAFMALFEPNEPVSNIKKVLTMLLESIDNVAGKDALHTDDSADNLSGIVR